MFSAYVDGARGELSRSAFLTRLSASTGISFGALTFAARGARVSPEVARKIEQATAGAVPAADLVLLPSRAEIREASQ